MNQKIEAKVVLLGSTCVGKTSIVIRICSDEFDMDQPQTIGVQYQTKTIVTDRAEVTLRIWDTAGQERFRALAPMYYQGSRVAIIVFSLKSRSSLSEAEGWIQELQTHLDDMPVLFLVGNMADLQDQREVSDEEATALADRINAQYFETSAKTGQNIQELFAAVADRVPVEGNRAEQSLIPVTTAKGGCGC